MFTVKVDRSEIHITHLFKANKFVLKQFEMHEMYTTYMQVKLYLSVNKLYENLGFITGI